MIFQDIDLIKKGVLDGRVAYVGPEVAHISICDFCNLSCIMCWDHAPYLSRLESHAKRKAQSKLSFKVLQKLFDELYDLKTRTISLVGAGEPLLHTEIKDILHYLKSKEFTVTITTSGVHLNDKFIDLLKDFNLNLRISLHGGDFDTWKSIHPKLNRKHFNQLTKILKRLSGYDNIRIYFSNVISKFNFHNIEKIVDLAIEVGAKETEFNFVDIFKGIEFLELTQDDMLHLKQSLEKGMVKAGLNNIRGNFKSFIDMVSEKQNRSSTTKSFYNRHPCIIGWVFTVINSKGDVYPCCGSSYYLGNIFKESFSSIWNSENYQRFREESKNICKNKIPVKKSKCWDCSLYDITESYIKIVSCNP